MEVVYEISVKVGCEVALPLHIDCNSRLFASVQCRLTYNKLVKTGGQDNCILYQQPRGDG